MSSKFVAGCGDEYRSVMLLNCVTVPRLGVAAISEAFGVTAILANDVLGVTFPSSPTSWKIVIPKYTPFSSTPSVE